MPQQSGSPTLGRGRFGTGADEELLDFNDSGKWRRLFAELMGTFFLVLVAAGASTMDHAFSGQIGRVAAVIFRGLGFPAMSWRNSQAPCSPLGSSSR